jgi:hypothetical protein
MQTPELSNEKIGQRVNDHICMCLGIYVVGKEYEDAITPNIVYPPLLGTTVVRRSHEDLSVVNFDFLHQACISHTCHSIGSRDSWVDSPSSLLGFQTLFEF